MKPTTARIILLALTLASFSGCPQTIGLLPALFGVWMWNSPGAIPADYVLDLAADGDYGMEETTCSDPECSNILVTRESGRWEVAYGNNPNEGTLFTRADGDAPKDFLFEWDENTQYQLIGNDTLVLRLTSPAGVSLITSWQRVTP